MKKIIPVPHGTVRGPESGSFCIMFYKKDKKLFGNDIEPKCEYCAHSVGSGEDLRCSAGLETGASSCARFRYDPLKRAPDDPPELKKQPPEDFSL